MYQPQCEGKYCMVEGNETLSILFNPVNQLHLLGAVDYQNCKLSIFTYILIRLIINKVLAGELQAGQNKWFIFMEWIQFVMAL